MIQGLARALWANNQLATELQLRLAAIKEGSMPGARPDDFHASMNKVRGNAFRQSGAGWPCGVGRLSPCPPPLTHIRPTCLSQGAYSTWSKAALRETEGLLQRQLRLPECNGLLEVTVVRAEQLTLNTKAGWVTRLGAALGEEFDIE